MGALTAPTAHGNPSGTVEMPLFLDTLMETILTFAAVVECIAAGILLHRLLR